MGDMSNDRNVYKLVDHLYATDINRTFWNQVRSRELDISKQLMLERFLKSDRSERSLYDALMRTTAEVRLGYQADKHVIAGDKMPGNLYYVPTLINWFPDAKVIHMFRDPRAILASERKRLMDNHGPGLILKRIRPIYSIVVVLYVTLTWLYAIRLHRIYSARYPDNYCLCKYEDLIENPNGNIKRLCEYLGIGFDNRMLTPERMDSSFDRTGCTGFDQAAVHRWKLQLKPWMKVWLSVCGGRCMKQFGYVP